MPTLSQIIKNLSKKLSGKTQGLLLNHPLLTPFLPEELSKYSKEDLIEFAQHLDSRVQQERDSIRLIATKVCAHPTTKVGGYKFAGHENLDNQGKVSIELLALDKDQLIKLILKQRKTVKQFFLLLLCDLPERFGYNLTWLSAEEKSQFTVKLLCMAYQELYELKELFVELANPEPSANKKQNLKKKKVDKVEDEDEAILNKVIKEEELAQEGKQKELARQEEQKKRAQEEKQKEKKEFLELFKASVRDLFGKVDLPKKAQVIEDGILKLLAKTIDQPQLEEQIMQGIKKQSSDCTSYLNNAPFFQGPFFQGNGKEMYLMLLHCRFLDLLQSAPASQYLCTKWQNFWEGVQNSVNSNLFASDKTDLDLMKKINLNLGTFSGYLKAVQFAKGLGDFAHAVPKLPKISAIKKKVVEAEKFQNDLTACLMESLSNVVKNYQLHIDDQLKEAQFKEAQFKELKSDIDHLPEHQLQEHDSASVFEKT